MYSDDGGSRIWRPPDMTMPAPSGLSKLQPHAACSCKHVCHPKAAGDSKMPEQSPKGTTIEPKMKP